MHRLPTSLMFPITHIPPHPAQETKVLTDHADVENLSAISGRAGLLRAARYYQQVSINHRHLSTIHTSTELMNSALPQTMHTWKPEAQLLK